MRINIVFVDRFFLYELKSFSATCPHKTELFLNNLFLESFAFYRFQDVVEFSDPLKDIFRKQVNLWLNLFLYYSLSVQNQEWRSIYMFLFRIVNICKWNKEILYSRKCSASEANMQLKKTISIVIYWHTVLIISGVKIFVRIEWSTHCVCIPFHLVHLFSLLWCELRDHFLFTKFVQFLYGIDFIFDFIGLSWGTFTC